MAVLTSITGGKKEVCPYCGKPAHETPLCCPRIKAITLYASEEVMEIEFFEPQAPEPPEAA